MKKRQRRTGPDFLGIGAPKAGTTWLADNLRTHPEIWIPPIKEIHWFDEVAAGGPFSLTERLVGRRPEATRARRYLHSQLRSQVIRRPLVQTRWKWRFVLRRRNDEEYLRLFADAPRPVTGEVTPSYCDLDEAMVRHVHALLPDAKIVLMMRDPVERAWSDCRRTLGRLAGRRIEDIPDAEITEFLHSPMALARSDYVAILDRWRSEFGDDRVLGVFLDDVSRAPESTYAAILDFLGVSSDPTHIPATVAERVHVGWGSSEVPTRHRRELTRLLLPAIERAARELDGPARAWLAAARRVADDAQPPPARS